VNGLLVLAGVAYPVVGGAFLLAVLWLGARWGYRRLKAGVSFAGARFYIEAGPADDEQRTD
jgi:hypothetical protein